MRSHLPNSGPGSQKPHFLLPPGLIFYLPLLDVCHKVDIRLTVLKIPLHTVKTQLDRTNGSSLAVWKSERWTGACRW